MSRHVNPIAGRLSLRPRQRHSLEILDRVTEIVPPKRGADIATALAAIKSEFSTVTDFEREFPSLCFALATEVGKTRLMGASSAMRVRRLFCTAGAAIIASHQLSRVKQTTYLITRDQPSCDNRDKFAGED